MRTSSVSVWSNRVAVAAELSHIFCCGIPILVAGLTLGANTLAFGAFHALHELLHDYEVLILSVSGGLLLFSGMLQYISYRIDCRRSGCSSMHGDCTPKKFRASTIFLLACVMYALNLVAFFALDHSLPNANATNPSAHVAQHATHDHHPHHTH